MLSSAILSLAWRFSKLFQQVTIILRSHSVLNSARIVAINILVTLFARELSNPRAIFSFNLTLCNAKNLMKWIIPWLSKTKAYLDILQSENSFSKLTWHFLEIFSINSCLVIVRDFLIKVFLTGIATNPLAVLVYRWFFWTISWDIKYSNIQDTDSITISQTALVVLEFSRLYWRAVLGMVASAKYYEMVLLRRISHLSGILRRKSCLVCSGPPFVVLAGGTLLTFNNIPTGATITVQSFILLMATHSLKEDGASLSHSITNYLSRFVRCELNWNNLIKAYDIRAGYIFSFEYNPLVFVIWSWRVKLLFRFWTFRHGHSIVQISTTFRKLWIWTVLFVSLR